MKDVNDRFDEKWEPCPATGCWLWNSSVSKAGYGTFSLGIRRKKTSLSVYSHRFSYERSFGSIPNGVFVCHHCDVPSCVNPAHLFLGTQKDNMVDCSKKGRTNRFKIARLSLDDVNEIRTSKLSGSMLSKIYGVDRNHINSIKRGKSWKGI